MRLPNQDFLQAFIPRSSESAQTKSTVGFKPIGKKEKKMDLRQVMETENSYVLLFHLSELNEKVYENISEIEVRAKVRTGVLTVYLPKKGEVDLNQDMQITPHTCLALCA